MTTQDLYGALDELHGYIRRHVAAGFLEPGEIGVFAAQVFADTLDAAVLRHHVQRYMREILAEQRAEQVFWPTVTDCERLDAAFAALERAGIVARQHFSCCGSCGAAEIWEELAAFDELGTPARGYVFYHRQDTEVAGELGGLYLSYGAVEAGAAPTEAVGRAVVEALEAKGLDSVWDGQWTNRIFAPLDWKRRR